MFGRVTTHLTEFVGSAARHLIFIAFLSSKSPTCPFRTPKMRLRRECQGRITTGIGKAGHGPSRKCAFILAPIMTVSTLSVFHCYSQSFRDSSIRYTTVQFIAKREILELRSFSIVQYTATAAVTYVDGDL
ncbi:hypothetical protein GYMLUDRAFT_841130 [Collybiopsis luxurians FD-317 M1]|uniref:Uncharacterized protein n=1 Tax=Collybiopsis luxurians FD-317 M1 TaxID=944289 RepID=A0A0D0BZU7_9AGAR|nr:hypothetical protein GYMLUDRAFT_841130 [Collybiopsis luxurians FD-317 M1]